MFVSAAEYPLPFFPRILAVRGAAICDQTAPSITRRSIVTGSVMLGEGCEVVRAGPSITLTSLLHLTGTDRLPMSQ